VSGSQVAHVVREGRKLEVQGGIDFSDAKFDENSGKMCILKNVEVDTLKKEPLLQCTHQNIEKCHYTYVTKFKPSQEEICQEHFQKKCRITFKQTAVNETVRKCYTPVEKVCNGQGPEECRTVHQASCTTKYVEKQPGKFVGDSSCKKLPVEICGAGCVIEEGAEECHDKVITSSVDTPEEVCDLSPAKTCRFSTKLVPSLTPEHQCTIVPKETCHLSFSNPTPAKKMLLTKWCLDDTEATPGESYGEDNSLAKPIKEGSNSVSDALAEGNDPDISVDTIPETVVSIGPVDLFEDDDFVFTEEDVPAVTATQSFYGPSVPEDEGSSYSGSLPDLAEAPQNFYGAPREARQAVGGGRFWLAGA